MCLIQFALSAVAFNNSPALLSLMDCNLNCTGSTWASKANSSMKDSWAKELGRADTPLSHEARKMGAMSCTRTRKWANS